MSIKQLPPGCISVTEYEILHEAVFDDTGIHEGDYTPTEMTEALSRFNHGFASELFVNPNHEEYVEITLRIPRSKKSN